jgi:acetyltransferase-like isoleucine patch superfamily enzyme
VVGRLLNWVPSPQLRARLLRRCGATIGTNVRIHALSLVNLESGFANLRVADDVHIGTDCLLDLSDVVDIGAGAVLAPRVMVLTHQDAGAHHGSPVAEVLGTRQEPTTIGAGAFVGAGSTVLCGVDVGHHAVVAAGSLVVGDVPPGDLVSGVPASHRRSLRDELEQLGVEFDRDSGRRADPDRS